jgi:hypothetical protein
MKYNISNYVLKVWLTSVIGGPVLLLMWMMLKSGHRQVADFTLLFVIWLVGALFSLPSLAVFYFPIAAASLLACGPYAS